MAEDDKKLEMAEKLNEARRRIVTEITKIIVGQEKVIEEILLTFFSGGHALIVGVPGLAKTLLVSTLSKILDLSFSRIQFTPDLMPSDIIGYEILQENISTKERRLEFIWGPVFANIVFADEINRTPPKTQSALLEAMQERKVTISGKTRDLPLPFLVLATQNPIEQEGTYPLPEAQLDRFLAQINIDYPSYEEEKIIVAKTTGTDESKVNKVLSRDEIINFQTIVREVPLPSSSLNFAVNLARMTRPSEKNSFDFVKKWVLWGAGPRGAQSLVLAAKANALLNGRFAVSRDDISRVAFCVLRHRVILNFQAQAEGRSVDLVVEKIMEKVR